MTQTPPTTPLNAYANSHANAHILTELYEVIVSRQGGNPRESHTAKLFNKGRNKICKKFGEEAVEVVVAALGETKQDVVSESSDTLYHLLVLWADMGIKPQDVWDELASRVGTSGIEEKNSRLSDEQGQTDDL